MSTFYHKRFFEDNLTKLKKLMEEAKLDTTFIDTFNKDHIYDKKGLQFLYDNIGIHHVSLNNCLTNGNLYLNRFFFSLEICYDLYHESIITQEELVLLVQNVKASYIPTQPKSKVVLAENILHPELTKTFTSIGELSRHLKGDRGTIRLYLNKKSKGLYRNQWKFNFI